jgi:hypothetical protein
VRDRKLVPGAHAHRRGPDAQLDLAEINRKLNEAAVEKPSGWGLSLVDPQAREGDE